MLYNPRSFNARSAADSLEIIAAHPFATLITVEADGTPQLTHCPMIYGTDVSGAWLEGHIARANKHHEQWEDHQPVLVAFNGPDAYVSPTWYTNSQNVPTWNYIAVHVRGTLHKEDAPGKKDELLKRLIAHVEPSYAEQWRSLPADYQQRMLGAIVGFRIRILSIEGKFKLSQNRQTADSDGVFAAYATGNEKQRALSEWMKRMGVDSKI